MSIVVVIPSRGRPARAWAAIEAIRETARLVTTSVILAVDADDPDLPAYMRGHVAVPAYFGPEVSVVVLRGDDTGNLVKATNTIARRVAAADPDAIIGNLGDDHLCRTPGWDVWVEAALLGSPGIAYGDDLLQREALPTAPFVSASIVNALGWYFLPSLAHMYVDDALLAIGREAGAIHYLPDVVIEHMHPGAGKADEDAGYRRADAETESDRAIYRQWVNWGGPERCAAKIVRTAVPA